MNAKRYFLIPLFAIAAILQALAADNNTSDTIISKRYNLDEVTVVSSRETVPLKEMPASGTTMASQTLTDRNINSLKEISAFVPNLFIPDYGSKLSSAVYIRGVGTRMTGSTIGLYVDNIPYLDKSAFDFDFYDIDHIEALRGPQGTLYGRNSMGGIINIKTLSPFSYQGTRLLLSAATYGQYRAQLSHYAKLNDKFGISASGYYTKLNGFFTNQFNGEKADKTQSAGGRIHLEWHPTKKLRAEYTFGYDYNDQNGYPYAKVTNGTVGDINYNDPGTYNRNLVNNGLFIEYQGNNFIFSSTTGYQYFKDKMRLDQDFTPDSMFNLVQKQTQHAITQEFIFKSKQKTAYQWVTGLFGFYQGFTTDSPMTFEKGGIAMIQGYLDQAKAGNPYMPTITITNKEMPIPGLFKNPSQGIALYHQSSYKFGNLTVTGGLRLDYEKTTIDYNSYATLNTMIKLPSPYVPAFPADSTYTVKGKSAQEFWQLLPKIAVKYDFNPQYNIYASVSKGYKTGGFNITALSDILTAKMSGTSAPSDVSGAISFKPESSWNYEIGTHSQPIKGRLFADLSIFFIDSRNQQLVTYTSLGSRMVQNAGRSQSKGAEACLRALITDDWSASVSYGYTDARFLQYKVMNQGGQTVDYRGNRIPFAPVNTLTVASDYAIALHSKLIDRVIIDAQGIGAGRIYWTEDNNASQKFYMLINGKVNFEKKNINLAFWTKNILNLRYQTFYFTSMGNQFAQMGKPAQFGVELAMHF
jgi:outer membrane receptor protein involved in Fe transport